MSEVPLYYQHGRHVCHSAEYRSYSKLKTRTALGSYRRARPRSIGPPWGRCVSLISSNPCRLVLSGQKFDRNVTKIAPHKNLKLPT